MKQNIFCGGKVFTRSEIPGGGAGLVGGRAATTTQSGDKHGPAWRGRGGEPPLEYADTNVKFVPKINRELKSG